MEIGGGSKSTTTKLLITGPTTPRQLTARTFNMIAKDAMVSRDVVSGIIPINSVKAYVLFDSGAIYSFVSYEFGQRLQLPCLQLDSPLNIEITSKKVILVTHVYKNCCIKIKGHKFVVDLIPI